MLPRIVLPVIMLTTCAELTFLCLILPLGTVFDTTTLSDAPASLKPPTTLPSM